MRKTPSAQWILTIAVVGLMVAAGATGLSGPAYAKDKKKKDKPKQSPELLRVETERIQFPPAAPLAPLVSTTPHGGLFRDNSPNSSLVSDFKPRRVGDLVFVDVAEASTGVVSSNAQRGRDSGTLGGIGTLAAALPIPIAGAAAGVVGALGTRKFEGRGSTERRSDLRARIVARVVEVLPNGDLVITAQKLVRINKEDERLALYGIVRQRDVSSENAIPTTAVGSLHVELNGKGVASADNAPGWLYRLFEKITPF